MPVSLPRVFGVSRSSERLWVRPDRGEWLASLGFTTARDFLALPGVVVSGHVGRNVSRVQLGNVTAYLKREHRIRWRDRFRSWIDGFGWSSISAREAAVLRHLDDHGLPGPTWLAYGEADGQGFLLLEEAAERVELRSLPVIDETLAQRLGEVIAGIHAAGVDQPDLFAKHVLVGRLALAELEASSDGEAGPATPSPSSNGEPGRVSAGSARNGSQRARVRSAPGAHATGLATDVMGGRRPASPSLCASGSSGPAASCKGMTILDWQRATLRKHVSSRQRIRALGALRATASPDLLPDAIWHRLVAAYLRTTRDESALGHWLTAVDRAAARMLCRKTIRSQRLPAGRPVSQELVRFGGETVCAIPDVAALFDDPTAIARLYDSENDGKHITLPNGRAGLLRVSRYARPFGRWFATLRGRPWRSHELKFARLLFHLERHGIPAPKLIAYGQTVPRFQPAGSFVLSETFTAEPLCPGHEDAALAMLDRLHQAECALAGLGPDGEPFGVICGRVVIRDATRLRLARRLSRRQMDCERSRLRTYFRGRA
jgi:hypothetical protein